MDKGKNKKGASEKDGSKKKKKPPDERFLCVISSELLNEFEFAQTISFGFLYIV